jgi:cbb3-type cytochrome oxidase subunit 3
MSPFWGNLIGAFTVISLLCFIGAWIWVWDRRHQRKYDALARLPLQDQEQS